jgi:hypothetical protein
MNSDSGDGSPEQEAKGPLSPQRGHSFIKAVINAIRSATSKSIKSGGNAAVVCKKDDNDPQGEEPEDTTEMLDSETEPCLMMDNVLEDAPMPDSHSHNMVSTSTRISQIEMPSIENSSIPHDDSLDNLSQAIANRQQIELQSSIMASRRGVFRQDTVQSQASSMDNDEENEASMAEMPSITDYCNAQALVDQVIDVDNLITKLLKVLRLVQLDNDHCLQELIEQK